MNIHEHQAKQILKEFGAPVSNGIVIYSVDNIKKEIVKLKSKEFVLKAQIHAGGRGKAGTGKKGDVSKPSIWHTFPYRGKVGFVSRKTKPKTINLYELENLYQGKPLDLGAMGYHKLLGRGIIYKTVDIKIPYATEKAIKKIENLKGKVHVAKKVKE